jgi:hypothetical protein
MAGRQAKTLSADDIKDLLVYASWRPDSDIGHALFDHLVGNAEQRGWHGKAEHADGRGVDDQLKLRRLHDRQLGRLGTVEDAAGINARLAIGPGEACSIADGGVPENIPKLRHRRHCGGEVELPRPQPAVPSPSCLPAQDAGNLGCARIFTGAAAPGDMLVGSHQQKAAAVHLGELALVRL